MSGRRCQSVYLPDALTEVTRKAHCQTRLRLRYHAHTMLSKLLTRLSGREIEEVPQVLAATAAEAIAEVLPEETTVLRTIGWISAGLGAVALGLFIGRELRQRYQFNRRTPYDFYAHSGDEQDVDFGLGI